MKNGRQRARIADVAKLAKVSPATVSRYINKSGFVARATGERVKKAIDKLDFVPDLAAGSLTSRRTRLVAVLTPRLAGSFFNTFVEELVLALTDAGYTAITYFYELDEKHMEASIQTALARRADAFVLTGPVPEDIKQRLSTEGVTVIESWNIPDQPIDIGIGMDNMALGAELAEFVHTRGYRRPLLIDAAGKRSGMRQKAFLERWKELADTEATIAKVDRPRFIHARAQFRALRDMDPQPDVVLCGSDGLAQGIAIEATHAGLKIPDQLAVIGFGDSEIAANMRPSLTTVSIKAEEIGRAVVDVLQRRLDKEEIADNKIDVGYSIVARESA